jgi:hypothetical protein
VKYARISFVALAGAAALASTFALGSVSAQAASGGTPAPASTRLVSTQELTQVKPDRVGVTPAEVPEVCVGSADEPEFNAHYSAITSVAYIHGCTTPPVSCVKRADVQEKSADTGGAWTSVITGPTKSGCASSAASIVSVPCVKTSIEWSYRTWGYYRVVWPDGGIDVDSNVSGTVTAPYSCGVGR